MGECQSFQPVTDEVQNWPVIYNAQRSHSALGSPPAAKLWALKDVIPPHAEVQAAYDPQAEQWRYDILVM